MQIRRRQVKQAMKTWGLQRRPHVEMLEPRVAPGVFLPWLSGVLLEQPVGIAMPIELSSLDFGGNAAESSLGTQPLAPSSRGIENPVIDVKVPEALLAAKPVEAGTSGTPNISAAATHSNFVQVSNHLLSNFRRALSGSPISYDADVPIPKSSTLAPQNNARGSGGGGGGRAGENGGAPGGHGSGVPNASMVSSHGGGLFGPNTPAAAASALGIDNDNHETCNNKSAAGAAAATPGLQLVDASGSPIALNMDGNTLVIGAATWCPHCAQLEATLSAPEVRSQLSALRIIFAFGDEGGTGPGGVRNPAVLQDLPGEAAFLAPGSVRPDAFPNAFDPATGQFNADPYDAITTWYASHVIGQIMPDTRTAQSQTSTTPGDVGAAAGTGLSDSPGSGQSVNVPGDYTGDSLVDASDYVLWRKTLGQTGPNLPADGSGNNAVDQADYTVWRTGFGKFLTANVPPFSIPTMNGIQVQVQYTVAIPGATDSQAFVFQDGRIAVQGPSGKSIWSTNAGMTWSSRAPEAPAMNGYKMAIQLGDEEILNLYRTPFQNASGQWVIYQQRSTDNWATEQVELAPVTGLPPLGVLYGDDCQYENGVLNPGSQESAPFLVHHGMLRLNDGRILISGYAVLAGDTAVVEGYGAGCRSTKTRAFVLTSNDTEGTSWGNFVQVGYDQAYNSQGQIVNPLTTPGIAGEGFNESDLARAPNGDIIMVMRSGGDQSTWHPPRTPLYMSRSSDEGQTWTIPAPIAEFGSNPNLVTLGNGIMGVIYGGNGTWMKFSKDNGHTWQGPMQISRSSTYPDLFALDSNNFLAFYYNADINDWAMTVIQAQSVPDAPIEFTSAPFNLAYGFTGLNGGSWNASETAATNSPTTQGSFSFTPAPSGDRFSSDGVTFPNRVLTNATSGGGFSGYVNAAFSIPITASYNGPIPADASVVPNYQLRLDISRISIRGGKHNSSTSSNAMQWNEITPGHAASSPSITLLTTNNFNEAASYKTLSWNPPDFDVAIPTANSSIVRTFTIPVSGGAGDLHYLDGIEIEGVVSLVYNSTP